MSATASSPAGPVLVATKLHVPDLRPGMVARDELVARLVDGGQRKLALLCAPAGWGKTILLSEWHTSEAEQRPFAWVSLDAGDDDPVRFWSYVLGALRTVDGELGGSASATLPNAGPDLVEAMLPKLINELEASSQRLVLVLDDYHLVRNELIQASVVFLLRHLPRTLQIVIAGRADPPLPLGSLRAAGEVTEIRAAELRFSEAEAEELLNGALGLGIEPSDVALLQTRTEGWVAGLQLAALSARAHEDKHAFIEKFAGDDRQIGDYLHEVLESQPDRLREFLLRTSILERMCADLCDTLIGDGDSAEQLDAAERSNLFLVALDERREWYRYHHLFRDLLRHELARAQPTIVPELHRRAAAWHRSRGDIGEAIAHATEAGDVADAADLIARHWRPMLNAGLAETVLRWIAGLPREDVLADARLCLVKASLMLMLGHLDEGEQWARNAEDAPLPGPFHDGMISVEANVAILQALHASLSGEVGRSVAAARRALSLHPEGAEPGRSIANIGLGHALYCAGEPGMALPAFAEAVHALSGEDRSLALIAALGGQALTQIDTGDLDRGERSMVRAEQLVEKLALGEDARVALSLLARGKLCELRGDPIGAEAAYVRAAVLASRGGRRLFVAHALLLDARVKRRRRDHARARALAREARAIVDTCPDPGVLGEMLARTERSLQLTSVRGSAPVLPTDPELSEREIVVLRLLASELSQREIGSELYVSFNTVKAHTRSIFRKLGVSSRADAVARSRELGLL